MRRHKAGFTLIELLVVIAVIAIVAGISVYNIRNILRAEQVRGASTAFQQMLWQGGTSASARLEPVILSFSNNAFLLRAQDSGTVIRREPLPAAVTTTFPRDKTLTFLPAGRLSVASYSGINKPVQIRNPSITYSLFFTVIGESKFEVSR